ncbi:MAG: hypothetical protein JEZ03_03785 [Bacteroidales bacterium]|nr:hypothetical protein [Bacteroidales bacterium]
MIDSNTHIFVDIKTKNLWHQASDLLYRGFITKDEIDKIVCNPTGDTFSQVNSNFACILQTEKYITAAVDHIRSIPLFYFFEDGHYIVSDKVATISKHLPKINLSPEQAETFRLSGYTIDHSTLIDTVKLIPPGTILTYDKVKRSINLKTYFGFGYSEQFSTESKAQLAEKLHKLHTGVFDRMLKRLKDQTIVLPLSGGLDSRLIAQAIKQSDHKKVICYTYGSKGNWESNKSKQIADRLGFKWIFVEYSDQVWANTYQDKDFKLYLQQASDYHTTAHIQDWPAVKYLKENQLIPEDSIFIPGHSYDFLQTGHLPKNILDKEYYTEKEIARKITMQHFVLWFNFRLLTTRRILKSKLFNNTTQRIPIKKAAELIERFNFENRQTLFIVNAVRVYEHFGYRWILPLWDQELVDYWMAIKPEHKLNRNLFYYYANQKYTKLNPEIKKYAPSKKDRYIRWIQKSDLSLYFFRLFTNVKGFNYGTNSFYRMIGKKRYFCSLLKISANINSFLVEDILKMYKSNSSFDGKK